MAKNDWFILIKIYQKVALWPFMNNSDINWKLVSSFVHQLTGPCQFEVSIFVNFFVKSHTRIYPKQFLRILFWLSFVGRWFGLLLPFLLLRNPRLIPANKIFISIQQQNYRMNNTCACMLLPRNWPVFSFTDSIFDKFAGINHYIISRYWY